MSLAKEAAARAKRQDWERKESKKEKHSTDPKTKEKLTEAGRLRSMRESTKGSDVLSESRVPKLRSLAKQIRGQEKYEAKPEVQQKRKEQIEAEKEEFRETAPRKGEFGRRFKQVDEKEARKKKIAKKVRQEFSQESGGKRRPLAQLTKAEGRAEQQKKTTEQRDVEVRKLRGLNIRDMSGLTSSKQKELRALGVTPEMLKQSARPSNEALWNEAVRMAKKSDESPEEYYRRKGGKFEGEKEASLAACAAEKVAGGPGVLLVHHYGSPKGNIRRRKEWLHDSKGPYHASVSSPGTRTHDQDHGHDVGLNHDVLGGHKAVNTVDFEGVSSFHPGSHRKVWDKSKRRHMRMLNKVRSDYARQAGHLPEGKKFLRDFDRGMSNPKVRAIEFMEDWM